MRSLDFWDGEGPESLFSCFLATRYWTKDQHADLFQENMTNEINEKTETNNGTEKNNEAHNNNRKNKITQ